MNLPLAPSEELSPSGELFPLDSLPTDGLDALLRSQLSRSGAPSGTEAVAVSAAAGVMKLFQLLSAVPGNGHDSHVAVTAASNGDHIVLEFSHGARLHRALAFSHEGLTKLDDLLTHLAILSDELRVTRVDRRTVVRLTLCVTEGEG